MRPATLANYQADSANQRALEELLLADFNKIVAGPSIYERGRFGGVRM